MSSFVEQGIYQRTYRAIRRWDFAEDMRNLWRCSTDPYFRPIMTGEWMSSDMLKKALSSINDIDYEKWCLSQNEHLRTKAIDQQVLYTVLAEYQTHIFQHQGICAEFGVFQGHSLQKSAQMLPKCQWFGFDSFEGFEQAWGMNNDQYILGKDAFSLGGKMPDIRLENITLVKGYFSQSLPLFMEKLAYDDHFSFVHIDCDTFDAVTSIFDHIGERLVPGTILVMDDLVGIIGITDAMKAFYNFVQARNLSFEWLYSGRGPNEYTVLDRGCVLTHWLFTNRVGMFSAACILT